MKETNRQATHLGTCQSCGAMQKLPGGRLSTHGYTTKWGFFMGVCQGTNHLPFEQSKDLIDACIVSAQSQIEKLESEQSRLRAINPANQTKAEVQVCVNGCRVWETLTIKAGTEWGFCAVKTRADGAEISHQIHNNEFPKTIAEQCAILNEIRAESYDKTIRQAREYIQWQQKRIADWKPGTLKALAKTA